ncbi:hypothetical protein ACSP97_13450 [Streptomyces sp. SCPE 10]|uniref:hypothetical protein n=1 Tax=Streptomyces sp. SCPE 10 TaxID=3449273 RepID=UPI003F7E19F7
MGTRFLDALTHSGPGYELTQDDAWVEPRSSVSHFLDAVTHNGPGYSLPSAAELSEIAELKRRKRKDLDGALLEGFEQFFYAKGHLEAAARAESPEEKKQHIEAAVACLRAYLQHADGSLGLALEAAREALGPLDLRSRLMLHRLDRVLRRLKTAVQGLLVALQRSGKPREQIAHQSQVAVKRATRSMEVLCHAVAR